MNRKISSLSHKRDSYSLYFFSWPHSPLYIGKHLQIIKVLPWRYRQSLRGVSAIWEIFIVFVCFFPSFFYGQWELAMDSVSGWLSGIWTKKLFLVFLVSLFHFHTFVWITFFFISFVSPFTIFRFLPFFLGRGV